MDPPVLCQGRAMKQQLMAHIGSQMMALDATLPGFAPAVKQDEPLKSITEALRAFQTIADFLKCNGCKVEYTVKY